MAMNGVFRDILNYTQIILVKQD